jgi:hypothetical protein
MRVRDLAFIVLAATCAAHAAPSQDGQQADAISKTESRALPPGEVSERVMHQLAGLLIPILPENASPKPVRPLTFLNLVTRPRPTAVVGLCRTDSLTVSFAKSERGDAGPDTPVKADGVEAHPYYHFLTPPKTDYELSIGTMVQHAVDVCQKLDPVKDDFFSAPDEQAATDGSYLVGRVKAALDASQNPPFGIACEPVGPDEKLACPTLLSQHRPEQIVAIDYCDTTVSGFQVFSCYSVDFKDHYRMMIQASLPQVSANTATPMTVREVKLKAMIVLRDPLRD